MRKYIGLNDFECMMLLLETIRSLDLMCGIDFMVVWEKKPRLTINRLGNFEFANPQEVYGAALSFWDEAGCCVGSRRFTLMERFDDDY